MADCRKSFCAPGVELAQKELRALDVAAVGRGIIVATQLAMKRISSRHEGQPEEVAAELERIRKDKLGTGGLPRVGRSFAGPIFVAQPH